MDAKLEHLTGEWEDKLEAKDKKNQNLTKNIMANSPRNKVDDQFHWLNLKTKYEAMKKKFRTLLVEKLNEFDNINKVVNAID